ncbi:MAG: oxidoreductase [Moraxellaceae bacterium]|jgi:2-hydroxychromene-2-carboxylate isomerase|nr:oxidoreductase [Moraxellaceae bacterium]
MVKAPIQRAFSRLLTSESLRDMRGALAASWRRAAGNEAVVHYFHQADDPYSQLTAALLPVLRDRYHIRLEVHAVPPPTAAAAPDRERLQGWSARDAARLATHFGVSPQQQTLVAPDGAALRQRLGHYLGATFYFEGEWYWGLDRLHYLERRLIEGGLARGQEGPLFPPPELQWNPRPAGTEAPPLHFYCSLRSPYTYLAVARVRRLAAHYGAELRLRFVLPMAMRGLPVPLEKRLYIVRDVKREALRLGLPFGCIVDPVGAPVERGMALLHRAVALGKGLEFLESFLQGVFADGLDAGSRRGLEKMGERAGLDRNDIREALVDDSWRAVAEANRAEMLALGLWGVPTFRVEGCPALWGQDRLWMLEQDLIGRR